MKAGVFLGVKCSALLIWSCVCSVHIDSKRGIRVQSAGDGKTLHSCCVFSLGLSALFVVSAAKTAACPLMPPPPPPCCTSERREKAVVSLFYMNRNSVWEPGLRFTRSFLDMFTLSVVTWHIGLFACSLLTCSIGDLIILGWEAADVLNLINIESTAWDCRAAGCKGPAFLGLLCIH